MREKELRRWITALVIVFFLMGLGWSTWLSRFPTIRDTLGLSLSEMSILVLMPSLGTLTGLLLAGNIVPAIGERKIIIAGVALMSTAMPLGTFLLFNGFDPFAFVLLFVTGVGFGLADVAANVSGSHAERSAGKSKMMLLHTGFSFGGIFAVAVGALAEAIKLDVLLHQLIVLALALITIFIIAKRISPPALVIESDETVTTHTGTIIVPNPAQRFKLTPLAVALLGFIGLAGSLADGVATDWMPLAFVDVYKMPNSQAVLVLSLMFIGQLSMRLVGDTLVSRHGRRRVLQLSFVIGFVGVMLVALSPFTWLAVPGAFFWGAGAALAFPISISAAADDKNEAAKNVSIVSTFGYSAYAAGPVAFGFMGDHFGLRLAFVVLAIVIAFAFIASAAVKERTA